MKIFIYVLILSSVHWAHAETFFGGGKYSKSGGQENVSWTLGDWLLQKQKFKLMDQWLALNNKINLLNSVLTEVKQSMTSRWPGIRQKKKLNGTLSLYLSQFLVLKVVMKRVLKK